MRKDGKKVRSTDVMYHLIPYFMPHRYDAMNSITLDIPEEPMQAYRSKQWKEGKFVSHMAMILAAYVRTVAEYPYLNRFIVNKKIYAHNTIEVALVVQKAGKDSTFDKVIFEPSDDIFTVQKKLDSFIDTNRKEGEQNGLDHLMNTFMKAPWLINFAVGVIRVMDRYGLLPKALLKVSPFHGSMVISNLASIRTNHIYHHVYDFGTMGMVITMGNSREVAVREKGEVIFKRCVPMGIVMDERICSGEYYATAFRRFGYYLKHPELLEGELKVYNPDPDIKQKKK